MRTGTTHTIKCMNAGWMLAFMLVVFPIVSVHLNAQSVDTVLIRVLPDTQFVEETGTFEIQVRIDSDTIPLDGTGIHLDFDPEFLEVVSLEGNTSVFPLILENLLNNEDGTIDYSAGTFSNFPVGEFNVLTITFLAKRPTEGTALMFAEPDFPRETIVTSGGSTFPVSLHDAWIGIDPLSTGLDDFAPTNILPDITVFPNPNGSGILHFDMTGLQTGGVTIELTDIDGRTVAQTVLDVTGDSATWTWRMENRPDPGPYFCSIYTQRTMNSRLVFFIE